MGGRKESQKSYWITNDCFVWKIWEEIHLHLRTPWYDIIVIIFIHYNCEKCLENRCPYVKLLENQCLMLWKKFVLCLNHVLVFSLVCSVWGVKLTDLGNLTISKYALHSQWSKSEEIICSICESLSILKSISPLNRGVLYLQHPKLNVRLAIRLW